MTDDILHTIQNPDELRRLATELLTAQAREYEQRLHNLNTVNATLEQRIHDRHAAMQAEKTAYEQRIRELEEALKLAQQWRFGRKSERLPASQKPLADEDAASDEADITRQLRDLLPPEEKTGKKPVRQPLPAHLPREETVLAPETGPGDGHPYPGCGAAMRHIRDEVNEVLEYVPAHFVVKRTVRPQYGCPDCDTVHSAALPAAIIDKGQAGPGLLTQVVIAKVLDHLPLQRQQKIYVREGITLPVSTLADWFGQTAAALKRDLLTQPVLQADETPLQILDTQKGKAKKGWLWAYVSAAGSARDIVVYDCRPGRGGEYARAMLAGWSGTLVVDGYAGYSALFRGGQEGESPVTSGIREAGGAGARAQKVHGAVQDERQSGSAGGAGADTGAVYLGADHPVPAGGAEATMATTVCQTADGGVPCVAERRRKNECVGRGAARRHHVCAEAVAGADDVPG